MVVCAARKVMMLEIHIALISDALAPSVHSWLYFISLILNNI